MATNYGVTELAVVGGWHVRAQRRLQFTTQFGLSGRLRPHHADELERLRISLNNILADRNDLVVVEWHDAHTRRV